MLQLKKIRKEYKTGDLVQTALNDVSLNLRDSEFVAILGPSGSGKTTLLNIIGGLDRYDSGDLVINGISTKKYTDRDWDSYRNHTIGFVFQSYNLIPHQTVLANVELALTISGVSKEVRRKKAIAALEKVGLGKQLHKRPSQMSGGQMQRLALMMAYLSDKPIVILDEPTAGQDAESLERCAALIREMRKEKTVLIITHDPELLAGVCDRCIGLSDGHAEAEFPVHSERDLQAVRQYMERFHPSDAPAKKRQKERRNKRHSFFPQLILEFLFSFQNKTSLFIIS